MALFLVIAIPCALLGAVIVRNYINAGPCEGPGCRGRAWYNYKDGRNMCGDCCWLADQGCLDLGTTPLGKGRRQ